jgi:hypothetical protein
MSRSPTDQKKLTIRVRIPQSAVSPEIHRAQLAARSRSTGLRIAGGALLLAAVVAWLLTRSGAPESRAPDSAQPVEPAAGATLAAQDSPRAQAPSASSAQRVAPGESTAALATTAPPDATNAVVRALITETLRGNVPGDPVGPALAPSNVTKKLHFYTELNRPTGKRYAHVWEYNGKPVARIEFKPHSNPWRASSNKRLPAHMQGEWRAKLIDEMGIELASVQLIYGENAAGRGRE